MRPSRCRAAAFADRRHVPAEHPGLDVVGHPLVLVLCAFTPDMEPVFEAVAAAATAVGLRAVRVKDVPGDYRVTDTILTLLKTARLVVADLTHDRPNVYFELGYARGFGKTVVTTIRAGSKAHFNVQDWTYLEYIDSRPLEHEIRQRFAFELSTPKAL